MRLLKVQGKGSVSTEPDMVTLSFNVEVEVWEYEECLRTLNARAEELRQSMVASGLDKANLKTSSFSVRVNTQYKKGRHIFAGYSASHRMQIELPLDKALLNKVLRHVAQGHSGAEINITFSVKDKDSLRKRVLTQAVQTAKENAETLASAAGLNLGNLMQMDYGWAEVRIYDRTANLLCESIAGPEDGYSADIEPEDIRAEDNVTLVYEIAD
jgi:hypothetical protein